MNTAYVYGRLLVRALLQGVNHEKHNQIGWSNSALPKDLPLKRQLHLLTATAGMGKADVQTKTSSKLRFGDDAYFVAEHNLADVLGVADGVGGWRVYGLDPSLVSCSLMKTCERLVKAGHFKPKNPSALISASYTEIQESKDAILGSCTACLISFCRHDETLYSANLGDSGFVLVRDGEVVHRSNLQQHYFNTPFQLAFPPSGLEGQVIGDSPESAVTSSFDVEEGDFVLLGTDGLFDNMTDTRILKHLSNVVDERMETMQKVVNDIAEDAHALSLDPNYMSPFSLSAQEFGFNDVTGGKPDDITILLSRVTSRQ